MTWRRIKLYLIGVGIGLLITLVLLRGRTFDSCSPEGRVVAQIASIKTLDADTSIMAKMKANNLSMDTLRQRIAHGKVDFNRSQAQKEPCREYLVSFNHQGKKVDAYLSVCTQDSAAHLLMLEGF